MKIFKPIIEDAKKELQSSSRRYRIRNSKAKKLKIGANNANSSFYFCH